MDDLSNIIAFFGWCTVINLAIYGCTLVILTVFKDLVLGFHTSLFNVSDNELELQYFKFVANYKLAIVIFNLVPYCALKLIT